MKTISEWIEELPDGYRELAFDCLGINPPDLIPDIETALRFLILFSKTHNELKFWEKVYKHYAFGRKLPKLPIN